MPGRKPMPLKTRFWEKVEKTDACWRWLATKNNKGYGMFYAGAANGSKDLAHRVSWILHNGPIPEGKNVLHRCDNPECTNPEHLFVGSHRDNMRDKHAKGRAYPASADRRRKLTPEQGAEAKKMHEAGTPLRALARHFGCDRDAVRHWL
jgi:HNH endonuclease